MGKTFRRTNSSSKHFYVDDWKRHYRLGFDPVYSQKLLKEDSKENRELRGYWHTDRYKPGSSTMLRLTKKESNKLSRRGFRDDVKKINQLELNNIEQFVESDNRIHKRNRYKWIWVY